MMNDYLGTPIHIGDLGIRVQIQKAWRPLIQFKVVKIDESKPGNAHRGKNISKETIEKWKISRKGYNHSEETKLKISQGLKNHYKQKEG